MLNLTAIKNFITANNFFIVFALFLITIGSMGSAYYFGTPQMKEVLGQSFGVFSQSILIFNILLLIYDKLLQRVKEQKDTVAKLNDFTVSSINTIFNKFYSDKDKLEDLYNEIFQNKIKSGKPQITYHEANFLFIIFQTIENVYRIYYISGADKNKYDMSQYDGWEMLILKIVASPKVQLFYKEHKYLFQSLDFNDYIERQYFTKVKQYVSLSEVPKK